MYHPAVYTRLHDHEVVNKFDLIYEYDNQPTYHCVRIIVADQDYVGKTVVQVMEMLNARFVESGSLIHVYRETDETCYDQQDIDLLERRIDLLEYRDIRNEIRLRQLENDSVALKLNPLPTELPAGLTVDTREAGQPPWGWRKLYFGEVIPKYGYCYWSCGKECYRFDYNGYGYSEVYSNRFAVMIVPDFIPITLPETN